MKQRTACLRLLLFLVVAAFADRATAQLRADFTAAPRSGCSPIHVTFTDLSTGNPTEWRWDLGNGVISTLQNPSAIYITPGTYTVRLLVRSVNGLDSVARTDYVTVLPSPEADFIGIDSAGCAPLLTRFTDRTQNSGTIVSRNWDFGDGASSSLPVFTHTYPQPGQYTVSLRVTNSSGCTRVVTKTNYIRASQKPLAQFTHTATTFCSLPFTVNFTNTTAGSGLTYNWNFGDGAGATVASPSHTYTSPGTYTVTLVASSAFGCRDTIVRTGLVQVGAESAFRAPDTVCSGQPFQLINETLPVAQSQTWHFGNGSTSTERAPLGQYPVPGTYVIRLVNRFAGGCVDSVERTVRVVPGPQAAFSADTTGACSAPLTVTFTSAAVGASAYFWEFGDGQTSTLANPTHTYTSTGAFPVTLVVTSVNGCTDTLRRDSFIRIFPPQISMAGLPLSGCAPLTISPVATVVSHQQPASWSWSFGDGNTSPSATPQHTYANPGEYTVSLTVTTSGGCSGTWSLPQAARVYRRPVPSFTYTPAQLCAAQSVLFTSTSTDTLAVTTYNWFFGDGGTSTLTHPVYNYQDTGRFSVTLVVANGTCADTIRLDTIIQVLPPIARFSGQTDCFTPLTRIFRDSSVGATSWLWRFGDGTTSTVRHPVHSYTSPGNYLVELEVTNGLCTHRVQRLMNVQPLTATLTATPDTVCKGTQIAFSAHVSPSGAINSWSWDFGDGRQSGAPVQVRHAYDSAGDYTVALEITDSSGCSLRTVRTVRVNGPRAAFTQLTGATCFLPGGNSIQFANTSASDGQNPITAASWLFGDGTTPLAAMAPTVSHLYTSAGNYTVMLAVTDAAGCSDTLAVPASVILSQPRANFFSRDTLTCTNRLVRFVNQSNGNAPLQWAWSFGDGQQSVLGNPVNQYQATGDYTVVLKVTDRYGCTDSMVRANHIRIRLPRAQFTASQLSANCPPLIDTFFNQSTGFIAQHWDFGTGGTSTLATPVHIFNNAGTYTVRLVVTAPGGCRDTATQQIVVRGPVGSFTYGPLEGCAPFPVHFTATTARRDSVIWDFGNGSTQAGRSDAAQYTYQDSGYFHPKMILIDSTGCAVSVFGNSRIRSYRIFPVADADQFRFCDSGFVSFRGLSTSNDSLTGWVWHFGDGAQAFGRNVGHQYRAPGTFVPMLVNTTAYGCRDTAILPAVNVLESPMVALTPGNLERCVPAVLPFGGMIVRQPAGTLSWDWSFGNGQFSQQQQPPPQSYTLPGTYPVRLVVLHSNGCSDTVQQQVIARALPSVDAGADQVVCPNTSLTFVPSGAVVYNWRPDSTLSCSTCPAPLVRPVQNTTYYVTGTDSFGCSGFDSVRISVLRSYVFQPPVLRDTLCAGTSLQLNSRGGVIHQWTPALFLDNAAIPGPRMSPDRDTVITYRLVTRDSLGCQSDTSYTTIWVYPQPVIDAGPDLMRRAGDTVMIRALSSPDINYWHWVPSAGLSCNQCPNPVVTAQQTTRFRVLVRNAAGCSAFDDMLVTVTCDNGNVFIPNTFSPNGDGMNDIFFPRGSGILGIKTFRIFNRWGELIFERTNLKANDPQQGWNGMLRGQKAPADVYIYTCEVICANNEIVPLKGDVMIIQ